MLLEAEPSITHRHRKHLHDPFPVVVGGAQIAGFACRAHLLKISAADQRRHLSRPGADHICAAGLPAAAGGARLRGARGPGLCFRRPGFAAIGGGSLCPARRAWINVGYGLFLC